MMERILFVSPSQKIADSATQVIVKMGLHLPIIISKAKEVKEVVRNYPEVDVYVSRVLLS
jgi:hypothetical protein